MLFEIAATYFAKLAVTAQSPLPLGSHTTPRRGLKALSFAVRLPMLSLPLFLSKRRPRLNVSVLLHRRLSFTKNECVRKFVPWLLSVMGSYCSSVRLAPVVSHCG